MEIMSKRDILLSSIDEFFGHPENFEILTGILNKSNGVSLRNLEKFVTNYAKDNQTSYRMTQNGKVFSVHIQYKSSLCGYSKKFFDPFCRTERIEYRGLSTTVAQLNFIRWCIKNEVITNLGLYLPHPGKKASCTQNNTDTSDSLTITEEPVMV